MQIQRYRLNRASGHIYRVMESPFRLEDVGESLDMIILHATPPVRGEPFPNMPEQDWIGLCFLNAELNWSFTLLNSGKSNALSSFLHYTTEREISSVLTKVTLIPQTSRRGNHWFGYAFEALPLPDVNLPQLLKRHSTLPLIDPTVDLEFPPANWDELLLRLNSQAIATQKMNSLSYDTEDLETRSKFVIWN
ncbi:hypothetical protein [Coleofasciculus sp. E1-EBD-02]|uniref:hypothetical protein n=1 Tax=Coleofasciculus sp. E1-EBD-02 TaxID=3068481 RepID=UPI0032F5AEFF